MCLGSTSVMHHGTQDQNIAADIRSLLRLRRSREHRKGIDFMKSLKERNEYMDENFIEIVY